MLLCTLFGSLFTLFLWYHCDVRVRRRRIIIVMILSKSIDINVNGNYMSSLVMNHEAIQNRSVMVFALLSQQLCKKIWREIDI